MNTRFFERIKHVHNGAITEEFSSVYFKTPVKTLSVNTTVHRRMREDFDARVLTGSYLTRVTT